MKENNKFLPLENLENIEEKTVSSKTLFEGHVINLHLDDISLPNGKPAFREYCTHNGAVCVIPITDNNEVICVRQYRYAVRKPLIEIPAGKLDSINESPDDAVRRELREETGAIAGSLTFLGIYYGSPAILSEKIYMYLAKDLTFGSCDPDDDEFLETLRIPLPDLVTMVLNGEIEDGKTQSAVLKANALLNRG